LDIGNEYKKVLANLSNVGNFASVRLKLQLDFNKFWNYFEFIEQKKKSEFFENRVGVWALI